MIRTKSVLLDLVSYVLIVDAVLTSTRGFDFIRYVFTESRFALVAVVLWLGIAAFSLWLSRRFRQWAAAGFARKGRSAAAIIYAYLLFAVSFGLSLEYIGNLLGIAALETGGEEPNHIFTAIGLSVTGLSLATAAATIVRMRRVTDADA